MALSSEQDTYVVRKGVSPNTVSEISSKTKIFARPTVIGDDADSSASEGLVQVGVIASYDPSESRSMEPIRGIGYGDQIAEVIPGLTEPMTISITRTAQYLSNIYQVFGYKGGVAGLVRSLKHHRWPFDIKKETVFSEVVSDHMSSDLITSEATGVSELSALVTFMEGCWFQDWSTSYSSDSALVQENCSMMVSDVYDGTNQVITDEVIDTGNKLTSVRFSEPAIGG
jgi:hypothetical protein